MIGKLTALLVLTLVVSTGYLVSQLSVPVSSDRYNRNYSKNVIAQTRLTNIQFVVDSDAIGKGSFVSNLTFENPTNEKLTLTNVHGVYYYYNSTTDSGWEIAEGWTSISQEMPSGNFQMTLRMDLNPYSKQNPDFATVRDYRWSIVYRLRLGYISYQRIAIATGAAIQHEGPSYPSDEIYSVAHTYMCSIAGIWIFGFEIVVVSLIRKGRAQKTGTISESRRHNGMLLIIYASQSLGIIAAQGYNALLYMLIPPPPVDSFQSAYGMHGAAPIAVAISFIEINIIALAFLIVGIGLFFRKKWAVYMAVFMSLLSMLAFSSGALIALKPSADQELLTTYNIALGTLYTAIAVAHGIAIYLVGVKRAIFARAQHTDSI